MKRAINSIIAIAAVLGMASCAKELEQKVETPAGECNLVVTATIEQTKVAFTEETNALKAAWEVGDKVFGASESGACTFEVASVADGVATLSLVSGTAPGEGNHVFLGYAPNLSVANIVSNEVTLPFDGQNATLAHVKDHAYMYAQATVGAGELNLSFHHGVAVLEATGFTGIPMDASAFTLTVTGSNLTGSAKFANNAGVWGVVPVNSGAITVTTIGAGNNFVVVPPTSAATDLVFTLEKGGKTYEAKIAATKQIVAGKCYNVGALAFSEKAAAATGTDAIMVAKGYNLADYQKMDLVTKWNSYYNTTDASNHSKLVTATGGVANTYYATEVFNKMELPEGTVIVQAQNYRYRPEAWTNLGSKQSSRPGEVIATDGPTCTVVNSTWWGSYNFRAFNIAQKGGTATTDEAKQAILDSFGIYVPKSALEPRTPDTAALDAMMTEAGFDVSTYTKVVPELTHYAFWNSTDSYNYNKLVGTHTSGSLVNNLIQFSSTSKIYTKADLPNGTIIVIKSGYQVRPDGWITVGEKLASGRPAAVKTPITVVNDEWWGSFTGRAFNIQDVTSGSVANMTPAQHIACESALAFYVPKGDAQTVDVWKSDAAGKFGLGIGAGTATEGFLTVADGVVSFTENTTGAPRTATVSINGSTIKVTQLAPADIKGAYTFRAKLFDGGKLVSSVGNVNAKETAVTFGDPLNAVTLADDAGVEHSNIIGIRGLFFDSVLDAAVEIDYAAKVLKLGIFFDRRAPQLAKEGMYMEYIPELSKTYWKDYNFAPASFGTNNYGWLWFSTPAGDLSKIHYQYYGAGQKFSTPSGDMICCGISIVKGDTAETLSTSYNVIYQSNYNGSNAESMYFMK